MVGGANYNASSGGGTSTAAMPYIGSKISLVTNSDLRYEGKLVNINTGNSTVTLSGVKMYGTEGRRAVDYIAPSTEVFDYIIFNGKDIKDLTVSEAGFSVKEDPAVVAINVAPPNAGGGGPGSYYGAGNGNVMMPQQNQMQHNQMQHNQMQHNQMQHNQMQHNQMQHNQMQHNQMQQMQQNHQMRRVMQQQQMGGGGGPNYNSYGGPRGGGGGNYMDNMMPPPRRHNNNNRSGNGPNPVVGELHPQPNSSLKSQLADNFDFEEANAKFQKGGSPDVHSAAGTAAPVYDKNQSFFDNISCETLNRQQGRSSRVDREKQRELDAETFGSAAAAARGPRYYRRGGFRGGRGGAGGGGMMVMMMRNQNNNMNGPRTNYFNRPVNNSHHVYHSHMMRNPLGAAPGPMAAHIGVHQ